MCITVNGPDIREFDFASAAAVFIGSKKRLADTVPELETPFARLAARAVMFDWSQTAAATAFAAPLPIAQGAASGEEVSERMVGKLEITERKTPGTVKKRKLKAVSSSSSSVSVSSSNSSSSSPPAREQRLFQANQRLPAASVLRGALSEFFSSQSNGGSQQPSNGFKKPLVRWVRKHCPTLQLSLPPGELKLLLTPLKEEDIQLIHQLLLRCSCSFPL